MQQQLELVEQHCKSSIGRIEIVTEDNKLERVYFPIPPYFRKTLPGKPQEEEELRKRIERERQRLLDEELINWGTNW